MKDTNTVKVRVPWMSTFILDGLLSNQYQGSIPLGCGGETEEKRRKNICKNCHILMTLSSFPASATAAVSSEDSTGCL